jgi:hypothetical protein
MIATANTTTRTEPYCNLMTITPTRALNWLENANTNNRKVSDAYVKKLARDMKAGRWRLTHQGIAFDPHGVLLDGQHRLWAIVTAEMPIMMHVFFDVPSEALPVTDDVRPRSLADQLRLGQQHGHVTKNHTSTLRAMLGGMSGPLSMTSLEASESLSRHSEAVNFAISAVPAGKYICNATTRGVIARAHYSADPSRLAEFAEMLGTGVVPHANAAAVILLRQFLYNNGGNANRTLRERYARTERALAAFLKNEPITRLMPTKQELFPLPEEAKA